MSGLEDIEASRDALKGFRTYLNYLSAVRGLFRNEYGTPTRYCKHCLLGTQTLQGDRSLDRDYIERNLRLGWNTEYLLHLSGSEDADIQRLNNHWAPVQGYYAVYCAAEAAGYVLDGSPPQSHAKAVRKVTEYVRHLDVKPWALTASGAKGKNGRELTLHGVPDDIDIPNNLQVHNVDPAGMIGRCLRAEHKHRIDDNWQSKRQSGCYKYEYDPGPTGMLHFLYRLRIKANYRKVDIFLAQATEREVLNFGRRLRLLVVLGMMLMEVIVIRRIGKSSAIQFGERFLRSNDQANILQRRLEMYRELV